MCVFSGWLVDVEQKYSCLARLLWIVLVVGQSRYMYVRIGGYIFPRFGGRVHFPSHSAVCSCSIVDIAVLTTAQSCILCLNVVLKIELKLKGRTDSEVLHRIVTLKGLTTHYQQLTTTKYSSSSLCALLCLACTICIFYIYVYPYPQFVVQCAPPILKLKKLLTYTCRVFTL